MRTKIILSLLSVGLTACGGGGGSAQPPTGLSYSSPNSFVVGTPITALAPTVNGTVTSYSVAPSLPGGLSLDMSSGAITGTPTTATPSASYVVTAQNDAGSATFSLSITVDPAFALQPSTATTIAVGQVIDAYPTIESSSASPYPAFVDASQVAWTSSQPSVASVGADGSITGMSEGSTTVTANYQGPGYQGLAVQLVVQVSGYMLKRNLAVAGQGTRSYSIYVPNFTASGAHPLLVSMHGGGGTAMIQASTTQLNQFASAHDFYVAYLEGSGVIQTFNAGACCGSAQTNDVDDVAYATAVIDDVQANYSVDPTKTFASGFSNGSMMAHRLACAIADRIAGIAAVSGGSGEFDGALNQYYTCSPSRPIRILHIHATNDRNYPYAGGVGAGISNTNFYPIDSTIADWIARNNVTTQATVEHVTATTTCYHYENAADNSKPSAPVTLCKIDPVDVYDPVNQVVWGGGHSWPGGVRSPASKSDIPIADFDADSYLWNYLNQ